MPRVKRGTICIGLGLLLLAAALCITAYNFWDEARANREAQLAAQELSAQIDSPGSIPTYMLNPDMPLPTKTVDGMLYVGLLEIPALELTLPIISDWSYPGLRAAPCRYTGTPYLNNMVIAAHNYSEHFGRLKELEQGDEVIFTDVVGNVFTYQVAQSEILEPTAIKEMISEDWDLTLFTCTPGGQTRFTVRCALMR